MATLPEKLHINKNMSATDERALNIEELTKILGSSEEAEKEHDNWVEWQIEEDKKHKAIQYQRDRKEEYPSIEEVTVALAEKAEGNSTMWDEVSAKRLDIKSKYPKTI